MAALLQYMPAEVSGWIAGNLFEQAPISIAVLDPLLKITIANSNFLAVFGDAIGKPCHEVYKRSARPCEGCAALKTLRDAKSRISEGQGVDRIGQQASFVVHHSPVQNDEGVVTHTVNMSYDVTDRKQFQDQYNLIFEHAPCSLSVINRDFRIVRANAQMRHGFDEPIGAHCHQIYKGRDARCEECPALATFSDGKPHSSNQVRRASDGSCTYHLVSTAPLPSSAGHVIEMSLDVTQAHVLTERLLESEHLATVGQTVTQLAHSIKNILTGLQGGIYDIKTGQQRGDTQRVDEGMETLGRNFARITELVRNFLRFSKEHRPDLALTDPNATAEEIYALYRIVSEKNGIQFGFSPSPGIALAWFDARGLHTCLANLVSNAFEACKLSGRAGCNIALRVVDAADRVVFEVEDAGCGMDAATQEALFRGIFTTKGPSGTGLGLVMTHKIVQDHGGKITVRSAPGQGSLFRIELPRVAPTTTR